MIQSILRYAAALLLLFSLYQPGAVQAQVARTNDYATTLTSYPGTAFPYSGSLKLHVARNGIVEGTYSSADSPHAIPVTGGVDGSHIWLDISGQGSIAILGTFAPNGAITGSARFASSNDVYIFKAMPSAAP